MRWLERAQPLGLLVLRVVLGAVMIAHGYGKLFGGMHHYAQYVHSIGLPGWLAYPSAVIEFAGGLLVLVGFATRISAFFIFLNMAVAIWKGHAHQSLMGGYEFPLAVAAIAFVLIFFGAGTISIDWLAGGGPGRK